MIYISKYWAQDTKESLKAPLYFFAVIWFYMSNIYHGTNAANPAVLAHKCKRIKLIGA